LNGEVNVEIIARANSINILRESQLPVRTVEMEGERGYEMLNQY